MLKLTINAHANRLSTLMLLIVFLFGANQALFGQSTTLDNPDKVEQLLGEEKFNELLTSNPSYLVFLDTRCSSGYKIVDMTKEKAADFQLIQKIKKHATVDSELEAVTADEFVQYASDPNFNFLQYSFQFDRTEMTYYKLGSTGKVLMIFPVGYINQLIKSKANSND